MIMGAFFKLAAICGLLLAMFGLIGVVHPLIALRITSRRAGALLLVAGFLGYMLFANLRPCPRPEQRAAVAGAATKDSSGRTDVPSK
jgi:hypothetical protein